MGTNVPAKHDQIKPTAEIGTSGVFRVSKVTPKTVKVISDLGKEFSFRLKDGAYTRQGQAIMVDQRGWLHIE